MAQNLDPSVDDPAATDDSNDPHMQTLSIAMLGTRGVPARYGGFETAVEEVGQRLAQRGHRVRVYCRSRPGRRSARMFEGMELVDLPAVHRRSLETLSHTGVSALHLFANRTDVAFVFNSANAPWLPILRAARIPVATHVDGLEWQRAKWGPVGRRYYRLAEAAAVRLSDALIADAKGIGDYYEQQFGAKTEGISYGAPVLEAVGTDRLDRLGLRPDGYHLVVARFEPENHLHVIVEGFVSSDSSRQLVVVGSAPYADKYQGRLRVLAQDDSRVVFVGGVWDQALLNQLYAHALTYIHGHSVGGTNPSLLRALGAGTATIAYDVIFNREVMGHAGVYFDNISDVAASVVWAEHDVAQTHHLGEQMKARARDYDWDEVTDAYERLAWRLRRRTAPGPQRARRLSHGVPSSVSSAGTSTDVLDHR